MDRDYQTELRELGRQGEQAREKWGQAKDALESARRQVAGGDGGPGMTAIRNRERSALAEWKSLETRAAALEQEWGDAEEATYNAEGRANAAWYLERLPAMIAHLDELRAFSRESQARWYRQETQRIFLSSVLHRRERIWINTPGVEGLGTDNAADGLRTLQSEIEENVKDASALGQVRRGAEGITARVAAVVDRVVGAP